MTLAEINTMLKSISGFDKKVDDLIALTPYANCVELQFSKDNYKIFVPDGNVTHAVLQQIR